MGDTPLPTRSSSGAPTKKTNRRRYRRGRPPKKERGRCGPSRTSPKHRGFQSRPTRSASPPSTIKSTCSIHRTFQMRMQDLRNDKAVRARFFDSSWMHELTIGSSSWYSHPVKCTHTRSLNIGLLLHNGILIKLLSMGFIDYWITASFTRSSFDLLTTVLRWITEHMLDTDLLDYSDDRVFPDLVFVRYLCVTPVSFFSVSFVLPSVGSIVFST